MTMENSLLIKNKIIVPIQRERTLQDRLITLKENRECPGVINAKDEFKELDIVLQQKQIFQIRRLHNCLVQPLYLKFEDGEEIRCTVDEFLFHGVQNWTISARFNRFIVGRPNLLMMPVVVNPTLKNIHINRGTEYQQKTKFVLVECYNDDYPSCFEINPEHLTASRGYKLGDLHNALPHGIYLHPKYNKNMTIVKMAGDRQVRIEQELNKDKMIKEAANQQEENVISLISQGKKKEKKQNKTKVRSLKKIVQGMSQEEKEKFLMR